MQAGDSISGEEISYDGASPDLSADGMGVVIGGPGNYGAYPGRARTFKCILKTKTWRQVGR